MAALLVEKIKLQNVIGAFCNGKHLAITCYEHSTDCEFFQWWFEEELLKSIPKGHTVIMDNASFHRKEKLRELAKIVNVSILFLPANFLRL